MGTRFWHSSSCTEGDGTEVQFFVGEKKFSLEEAKRLIEHLSADKVLQGLKDKCLLLDRFGLVAQSAQILDQIVERKKALMSDAWLCPETVGYRLLPEGFPVDLYWTDDHNNRYRERIPDQILQLMEDMGPLIDPFYLRIFHSFKIWWGKEGKADQILIGEFFSKKYLLARWGKNLEPIFLSEKSAT